MQPVRNENYANSNNERLQNLGVAARPAAPVAAQAAPPMNNIERELLEHVMRESEANVGANAVRRKGQAMHEAVIAARKLEKQRLNALEASRPAVSAPSAVSATPAANAVLNQEEEEVEWNNTYEYQEESPAEAQENNSNSSNENSTKPVAKNGGSRKNKRISRRKVKSMKKRNHRSRRNHSSGKYM
jgi:hypothetical protein